jgi:hypothetical protein
MSTTSGVPTSASSCDSPQSESPQRELADFLTKESSRYVPLPYLFRCDAIFVHRWFATYLFAPDFHPQGQRTERLFELMNPDYSCATVMGIKLLLVNRNKDHPGRFRLRWSKKDEAFSEVFLISCFGLPDHAALIPTKYLRTRYGDASNIEGVFELDQACPSLLAPFMVHYRHLVKFLGNIFEHASTSATSDLINPTYSATYHGFKPELQLLHEVMPEGGQLDKLWRIHDLYFACRCAKYTMRLSRRGEAGNFMLAGHAVEYSRRSFCRVGEYGDYLRITLMNQLSGKRAWKFLLLEDQAGREAIVLPRNLVPAHFIGHARHGRHDNMRWPQVEVLARSFVPFVFLIQNSLHTVTAIATIMRNHGSRLSPGLV